MKKVLGLIVVFGAVASLSGCGDSTHDVKYYQAHMDEAHKRVHQCTDQGIESSNCQNARTAVFQGNGKPAVFH